MGRDEALAVYPTSLNLSLSLLKVDCFPTGDAKYIQNQLQIEAQTHRQGHEYWMPGEKT